MSSEPLKCHKCGATCFQKPYWLQATTPYVEGGPERLWECRPYCGADRTHDEAMLGAVAAAEANRE